MPDFNINRPKIAAIVPALNEELTVGTVVATLKQSPFLDEVIVVSSGSTDNTVDVARRNGATVFDIPPTGSKGGSMLYGLKQTDAPIIVFFDADLLGLNIEHVERLVTPVLKGRLDMCAGMRDRGPRMTEVTMHLPLISGERALRREIIEAINPKYLQGYMVETALNYYCRIHNRPYGAVKLSGLNMRKKMEKVGCIRGAIEYVGMGFQILKAMWSVRYAKHRGKF